AMHALFEIADVVLVGLDRPHNVGDGIQQLARERADALDGLAGRASGDPLMRDFAKDSDLRKAGADVVVQIAGDPGTDALHFEQPSYFLAQK
ncbi:MAG TPA: hypothetical protein VNR65_15395, partial [Geobacterales bacterium]|nr:hypothetical protein [Geobacterales bacterium]